MASNQNNIPIDTISQALNVNSDHDNPVQVYNPKEERNENIDNDYEYARTNLISIIERGDDALEHILQVAKQSQSPRAYEVFSTLLKNISDTNKDLMDLSRKKQVLDKEDGRQNTPSNVTQTAVFVGSTKELQKYFKKGFDGSSNNTE